VQLLLKPGDFDSAFLTWHLRDTSRLEEVKVLGDQRHISVIDYSEGMQQLLLLLSDKAPALHSLAMRCGLGIPPHTKRGKHFHFLPLVGALSRLESLVLTELDYSAEDSPTSLI
jgi:hypothetical protein